MSAAQKKPATRSIEKEIEINAPIETVWKALTDAKELTQWFPPQAGVTPGIGGRILLSWPEITDWNLRISANRGTWAGRG